MILRRGKQRSDRARRVYLLFGGELFIEIVEVETRWLQVLDARQESRGLELGHWSFKLRRNERERFVLNSERFVEIDGFWH